MPASKKQKLLTTRIVIADAQPIVRLGLRALVDAEPEMAVVAEADSFQELGLILGTVDANLLILDPDLPDMRGIDALTALQRGQSRLPMLVFSGRTNDLCVVEAVRIGVQGYVTKGAPTVHLLEAIRAVVSGHAYLDPKVASLVMSQVGFQDGRKRATHCFTDRERAVLTLLARGLRNRDISKTLFISEHTVKFHVTALFQKLQATNRTDVVRKAISLGLVSH